MVADSLLSFRKSDDAGFDIVIGTSYYHFDITNGYPVIYSRQARLQVPNVDNWCLSQTQGKFSYREIKLMADAYKIGFTDGLGCRDLPNIEVDFCEKIIRTIFEKGFIDELIGQYWLECTNKSQFISKFVPEFLRGFDQYESKYGKSIATNFLKRVIARLEVLDQGDLIKTLSWRLSEGSQSPVIYPDIRCIAESIINKYGGIASNEPNSAST